MDSPAHGEPTGASVWGGAAASPSLVTRSGTSQGLGGWHLTDVSGTPRTRIAPRRSPPRLRRPPVGGGAKRRHSRPCELRLRAQGEAADDSQAIVPPADGSGSSRGSEEADTPQLTLELERMIRGQLQLKNVRPERQKRVLKQASIALSSDSTVHDVGRATLAHVGAAPLTRAELRA